jgi:predicted MPP superfamily phosphohydrolase
MTVRRFVSRRKFLSCAAATLAACGGVGFYTWRVEPHWIEVVQRPLPIANLPDALVGQTLVQLSDLHVGHQVDDDYLKGAFALVGAMEPALVVITGDFMTCWRGEQIDHALRVLAHLGHGRLGTLAALGNHDSGHSWRETAVADRLSRGLRGLGIDVLRNQRKAVAGLTVVGLEDLWGPNFDPRAALAGLEPDAPALVLCHNPDGVDQPGWGDFRGWVLAGHTHGGQCKAPFFPPPRLPTGLNPRYVAGEVDLGDGRRLYVNRALGHLRRVRFNVRPEITAFTLTRAVTS